MTFRETLAIEHSWHKRAILISLYHSSRSLRNKKWTMRATAKRLGVSLGAVSEALKLSKAILADESLELLTRQEALLKIK